MTPPRYVHIFQFPVFVPSYGHDVQSTSTTTLKRKRDVVDDVEEELDTDCRPSSCAILPPRKLTVTETAVQVDESARGETPSVFATNALGSDEDAAVLEEMRPTKRRRTTFGHVVGGVAKTVAIAGVGAMAAWSALAFS